MRLILARIRLGKKIDLEISIDLTDPAPPNKKSLKDASRSGKELVIRLAFTVITL